MTFLPKLVAKFLSTGPSATTNGNAPFEDGSEIPCRYEAGWDEALMAAISDENARMVLEYRGRRWK